MSDPLPTDGLSALEIERLDVTAEQVQRLLAAQAPHFADLTIQPLAIGWDNAVFALGEQYVARMPRHGEAEERLLAEIEWLPVLAPRLRLPVPNPIFRGEADETYPWVWAISRRLPGGPALAVGEVDNAVSAIRLAEFCREFHVEAPPNAPTNPVRSVSIAERSDRFEHDLDTVLSTEPLALPELHDELGSLRLLWASICRESVQPPHRWIHGDLHPGNVLCRDETISAVVDFGDLAWGDPSADLAVAWYLFGDTNREEFFRTVGGCDPSTVLRSRGWAIAISLAILANSSLSPWLAPVARHAFRNAVRG